MFIGFHRRILQVFIEIRNCLGYTSNDLHLFSTMELIKGLEILQTEYISKFKFSFGYDGRYFIAESPKVKNFNALYNERKYNVGGFLAVKKNEYVSGSGVDFYTNETIPDPPKPDLPKQEWQNRRFGSGVNSLSNLYSMNWEQQPQRERFSNRNNKTADETTSLIPKSFDLDNTKHKPVIYTNKTASASKPAKLAPIADIPDMYGCDWF
jgi:hypothetical protein